MRFSRTTLGFQQFLLSIILILAISIACSAAGTTSTPQTIQSLAQLDAPLGTGWVVGDLDGDQKVDLAVSRDIARTANGYQYRVELKLTKAKTGSFTFSHSDGLGVTIAAIDVDGDHDLDLVIDGRFPGQRIGIWINDGNGTFTEDLQHRFTPPDVASLVLLRPDIPAQAIDDSFNPIPAFVFTEAFFSFHLTESRRIGYTAVPVIARIARGTKHLRAPPQASL
jgi:hypothetical protein